MGDDYSHDRQLEALLEKMMKRDVPSDVEARLSGQLAGFRNRLEQAARAPRLGMLAPPWLMRGVSATATVLVVMGLVLFLLGRSAAPSWAEVRDRFDSAPFFRATIYVKPMATAQPHQLELWMEAGGRLRLRAGNHVIFGERGRPVEAVSIGSGATSPTALRQARDMVEQITQGLGEADAFSLEVLLRALPITGTISAPLANENASVSDDLVVFDITDDESPEWVRIWALRESRLPVRLLFWDPRATYSVDVVLSYASGQAADFFDPAAFRQSLIDSPGGLSQAYGLFRDPGGRPITPSDADRWEKQRALSESEGAKASRS